MALGSAAQYFHEPVPLDDAASLGPLLVRGGHGLGAVGVLRGQVVQLRTIGLHVVQLPVASPVGSVEAGGRASAGGEAREGQQQAVL